MFRHLGGILYCTRCGPSAVDAVEEFMEIFVDQCGFMDYFKNHWLSNIGISQVLVTCAVVHILKIYMLLLC